MSWFKKGPLLVLSALVCTAIVVAVAVAIVERVSSSDQSSEGQMSEPKIVSQKAFDFPTGFYAYNLGLDPEGLSPEDEVIRCWGWDDDTAEQYARKNMIIDLPRDGGVYCKLVEASEALSLWSP